MSVRRAPRCPGLPPAPGRLHAVLSAGVAQGCGTKASAPAARLDANSELRKAFKAQLAISNPIEDEDDPPLSEADVEEAASLHRRIETAIDDSSMSACELADIVQEYDIRVRKMLTIMQKRSLKIDELEEKQRQLQAEQEAKTEELLKQLAECKASDEARERILRATKVDRTEARNEANRLRAGRAAEIEKSGALAQAIEAKQRQIDDLQNNKDIIRQKTKNTLKNMVILSLTAGLAYSMWQNLSQSDPSASCQLLQERETIRLANRYGYGGPGAPL